MRFWKGDQYSVATVGLEENCSRWTAGEQRVKILLGRVRNITLREQKKKNSACTILFFFPEIMYFFCGKTLKYSHNFWMCFLSTHAVSVN